MNSAIVFVLHLIATWYMVGLIWMVQIVHYNLFDHVGIAEFQRYEQAHARLITPIVMVPMLVELSTAVLLLIASPIGFPRWAAIVGLVLLAAIWLSTFFLQVPYHKQLSAGFHQQAYQNLVRTNWIRTILWTSRGALTAWYTIQIILRSTSQINPVSGS